ncbi:MAG TPA: hypothetical protein VHX19_04995 [Stellaceae bacterium]|jgi:hypothetical protein|nr:hypothetical protein [Stellaceae bacterium]
MSIKRRPSRIGQQPAEKIEESDIATLDREDDTTAPSWRPSRVERRDWRGEGVVGTYHTD